MHQPNGQTDGRTDGGMDGRLDGPRDGRTDRRADGQTKGKTYVPTDGRKCAPVTTFKYKTFLCNRKQAILAVVIHDYNFFCTQCLIYDIESSQMKTST